MSLSMRVAGLLVVTFASGCLDVPKEPAKYPECAKALIWAKETGIFDNAKFYSAYPFITKDSSLEDFQLALFLMTKDGFKGNGQTCVFPCSASAQALNAAKSQLLAAGVLDPSIGTVQEIQRDWTSTESPTTTSVRASGSLDSSGGSSASSASSDSGSSGASSASLGSLASSDSSGSGSGSSGSDSSGSLGSLASSDSGSSATSSGGSSASSATWAWWAWLLLALAICCLLPLLCLACAAMLCYEKVAWIFGGKKTKRAIKKNTSSKVDAQPQAPSMSYSAPAPQQTVTTVMSPTPMYTAAAPMVSYNAPFVPVSYSAPVPTTYASTPQFQVAPPILVPARSVSVAPQQVAYVPQPVQLAQPATYIQQPMQYVQPNSQRDLFSMLDRDGDGRVSREEFATMMGR